MSDCCNDKADALAKLRDSQSATLKLVLAINLIMFVVEFSAGIIASSTALLADSLDMLGDALVYGFSLFVVAKNSVWKAYSAFGKSGIMASFGAFVMFEAVWKFIHPVTPSYEIIGVVGLVALAANGACLYLLTKHRQEDVNMRSVWLCSRNDIITNVSVLVAATGVYLTNSHWPDIIIGVAIAGLFLRTAWTVYFDALDTLKSDESQIPESRQTALGPQ